MTNRLQTRYTWIFILATCQLLASHAFAQTCGFSNAQNQHPMFRPNIKSEPANFSTKKVESKKLVFSNVITFGKTTSNPISSVFLPRWSAENLPFFCKIEHDWAKNRARIPIKFRLGSVEYVDWLEGR